MNNVNTSKPFYLQALAALRRRETLFRILLFTLVTAAFWIGFSIFFSQQKTKVSIDIQKHTEPLNPNIDKTSLEELATRRAFTDQELANFPLYDRVVGEDKISKLVIAGSVVDGVVQETPATALVISSSSAIPSATTEAVPQATDSGNF
ncbi:MAG: hypothetical protein ABI425_02795 [Patescibacteria group bacterium]